MPGKHNLRSTERPAYNTNLASEFYVMSVLCRLGLEANLTLGNKKAVDIVVVRTAGDAVTVDVKAVVGKTDWLAGSSAVPEPRKRHFVVLLSYEGRFADLTHVPRAWVLPHSEYLRLVKTASTGTMRYLPRSQVLSEMNRYENAWRLIAGRQAV
jgi:hypothetical protein